MEAVQQTISTATMELRIPVAEIQGDTSRRDSESHFSASLDFLFDRLTRLHADKC